MLEIRSALADAKSFSHPDVSLTEAPDFVLTQLAGSDKDLQKCLGKLPGKVGVVLEHRDFQVLRIAPHQLWVLGDAPKTASGVYATSLSSGRTRIALSGSRARELLSACAAIDFHPDNFKPGHFVLTGIHHTPVLIQCIGEDTFHIFGLRTFAQNLWEWLCDVAEGLEG